MKTETAFTAADQYQATILGECKSVWQRFHAEDKCDLQDVVQEVHVRLWERRHELTPERDHKPLVRRIAHDAAVDFLRKQSAEWIRPIALVGFVPG